MTVTVVSEEEKMRRVPGIIFVDGATGRRARVKGTGLEVFEIVNGYKTVGEDLERLLRAFHWLKAEQILAALDYYRAFPDEIDAKIEEGRLAAEEAAGPEPTG